MCRVAVRQTPRARPAEPVQPSDDLNLYDQLQAMGEVRPDIDLQDIFVETDVVDLDAELQFLEMFHAPQQEAPQMDAVLGQPVEASTYQPVPTAIPAMPVMQQQQPVMQQQQAPQMAMQMPAGLAPVGFAPPAAALQQQYTQAILQQHMLAQLQASASGSAMPVNKRGKTAAEIAEQQERIKRRRRESAQRSRQRKSAYMKSLECENQALKVENERLRRELSRMGRPLPPMFNSSITATSGSSGLEVKVETSSEPLTGASSDAGLCPVDISGLGNGAAQGLMGMAI